jgi:AcrR family transcriptional regulator
MRVWRRQEMKVDSTQRKSGTRKSAATVSREPAEKRGANGPKRELIILASIDVFSRTNYEKATTAMIAREAGVAEGTLYKYFPSKKELFLECCRYVEGLLLERYAAIYRETAGRPVEYLRRVAASYLDFVRENPAMRKFLAFILNNTFDEDFRDELSGFVELNVEATRRMIEEGKKKGEISTKLDARAAAWMFVGGYFTLILMTEIGAEEVLDPNYLEGLLKAILNVE